MHLAAVTLTSAYLSCICMYTSGTKANELTKEHALCISDAEFALHWCSFQSLKYQ